MAKIELVNRQVIGDKLLACISQEGLVGILLDIKTLDMIIEVFEKSKQTENIKSFLHDMKQLRIVAFER